MKAMISFINDVNKKKDTGKIGLTLFHVFIYILKLRGQFHSTSCIFKYTTPRVKMLSLLAVNTSVIKPVSLCDVAYGYSVFS